MPAYNCNSADLTLDSRFQLRNGVLIPPVGYGTSHAGGYSHDAVVYALKDAGYRMIDTAKRYGCEEMLSKALSDSGIEREHLFLNSKVWPTDFGFQATKDAIRLSMKKLGVEYMDSFLIHWPEVAPEDSARKWDILESAWRGMESLYESGELRSIGVSNYDIYHFEKLWDRMTIVPHINQVEFHPYQNPAELREFCDSNGIQVQGFCPLGLGKIVGDEPIVKIATKHGKSPAQVLIRWAVQNGVSVLPKSVKTHRVSENIDIFDFNLTQEDMQVLDGLHDGRHYINRNEIPAKISLPDGYRLKMQQQQEAEAQSKKIDTQSNNSFIHNLAQNYKMSA